MGNQNYLFERRIMQVYIKTLTGKTVTLELEADMTVAEIKDQICMEEGIKFAQQKLTFGGKLLEDKMTVEELNLVEGQTVDLLICMQGGTTSTMDPAIVELSRKYNHDKKICRKCYATLPPRAEKCRKKACGHWPDIRPRKTIKSK